MLFFPEHSRASPLALLPALAHAPPDLVGQHPGNFTFRWTKLLVEQRDELGGEWTPFGLGPLGRLLDHLALVNVLSEDSVQVPPDEDEQHLLEFGGIHQVDRERLGPG